MNKKIKLLVITSLVAVMATGCSRFRGGGNTADGDAFEGGGSSQASGGSQVRSDGSRRGIFSQRAATCAPCAANTRTATAPKVYKPAAPRPYRAPAATKPYRPAGQHSQQWYVDRWKRQQQQGGGGQARTQQQNTNYDNGSNATYYDYSSAGQASNSGASANTRTSTTNVSTSNKSIYTGSYQKKTYKPYNPTTYSGGSSASTNTNTTYVSSSNNGGGTSNGKTYIVKKGDTVFEIMRQTGVYWKDIIKLNNLQAPSYGISPGQTIRLK